MFELESHHSAHHCPLFPFLLLFLSALLLPTGFAAGAKWISSHSFMLCFCGFFFLFFSQAKKFVKPLKSLCALSVTRTAPCRDSTTAVSMPRWVWTLAFSSLSGTEKQAVRSPPVNSFLPKLSVLKSFSHHKCHWQLNKMSVYCNYKASILLFEHFCLPLFL